LALIEVNFKVTRSPHVVDMRAAANSESLRDRRSLIVIDAAPAINGVHFIS
jgi:hypothetical protein